MTLHFFMRKILSVNCVKKDVKKVILGVKKENLRWIREINCEKEQKNVV